MVGQASKNDRNTKESNTMKAKILILSLMSALIIPASSYAQDNGNGSQCRQDGKQGPGKKGKQRMMHLKKIDTNQDQQISLEEAEAGNAEKLVEHFQTIDTNGDGVLTKDELKAHGQTIREQRKQEREAQGQ